MAAHATTPVASAVPITDHQKFFPRAWAATPTASANGTVARSSEASAAPNATHRDRGAAGAGSKNWSSSATEAPMGVATRPSPKYPQVASTGNSTIHNP